MSPPATAGSAPKTSAKSDARGTVGRKPESLTSALATVTPAMVGVIAPVSSTVRFSPIARSERYVKTYT